MNDSKQSLHPASDCPNTEDITKDTDDKIVWIEPGHITESMIEVQRIVKMVNDEMDRVCRVPKTILDPDACYGIRKEEI